MSSMRVSLEMVIPRMVQDQAAPVASEDSEAARTEVRFLTIDEAAAQLRIDRRTVQRKMAAGLIRKAPLGPGVVRISWSEILRIEAGIPLEPITALASLGPSFPASEVPENSNEI